MCHCYTSTRHCHINMSSAFGFFHTGFGQSLQSSSCIWCRSSCSLRGLEVFPCRGFLGTPTFHDLLERKKDLLLASSGFREASAAGLATLFMLRQFFNWMLVLQFFKKSTLSHFLVNNSLFLKIIFRLSLWLSKKKKRIFVCISIYYVYIHICVCTYICINEHACTF